MLYYKSAEAHYNNPNIILEIDMAKIHPTSIVSEGAVLADSVEVGNKLTAITNDNNTDKICFDIFLFIQSPPFA